MEVQPPALRLLTKRSAISGLIHIFDDFAASLVTGGKQFSGDTATVEYDNTQLRLNIKFIDAEILCQFIPTELAQNVLGNILIYRINFGVNNSTVFLDQVTFNEAGKILKGPEYEDEEQGLYINMNKSKIFVDILHKAHDHLLLSPHLELNK